MVALPGLRCLTAVRPGFLGSNPVQPLWITHTCCQPYVLAYPLCVCIYPLCVRMIIAAFTGFLHVCTITSGACLWLLL